MRKERKQKFLDKDVELLTVDEAHDILLDVGGEQFKHNIQRWGAVHTEPCRSATLLRYAAGVVCMIMSCPDSKPPAVPSPAAALSPQEVLHLRESVQPPIAGEAQHFEAVFPSPVFAKDEVFSQGHFDLHYQTCEYGSQATAATLRHACRMFLTHVTCLIGNLRLYALVHSLRNQQYHICFVAQ